MGKPRLRAKRFGEWLASAKHGRSHAEIAAPIRELLKPTGLKVNRSSILKIEQGRVPNVLVLFGLSRVLKIPIEEMVSRLLADLGVGVDLNYMVPTLDGEPITNGVTMLIDPDERDLLMTYQSATPQGQQAIRSMLRALEPDPEVLAEREAVARLMGRSRAVKKGT